MQYFPPSADNATRCCISDTPTCRRGDSDGPLAQHHDMGHVAAMSVIRLVEVSFAFPQQAELITECSIDLRAGWTGVVGPNGEGKSTLLNLLDGSIQPQSGTIDRCNLVVARCHQNVEATTAGEQRPQDWPVETFATSWTKTAMRWMSLLDLQVEDFWRWDALSPGTRRKWQIGAALSGDPGVLLLDEPTNHLDLEGRATLLAALSNFTGIGVVVSHDRDFLDRLTERTIRIRNGSVRAYDGGYTAARALWNAEAADALNRLTTAQQRARELRANLGAQAQKHSTAEHALSTRSRMKSVRDSDARSTAAKGRAQNAESSVARRKSVARAALDRQLAALEDMDRPETQTRSIFVDAARCPRATILQFDGPIAVGNRTLVDRIRLSVARDDRLWIIGPNGCGKTTLLNALLAQSDLPAERIVYVPQRLEPASVRAQFDDLPVEDRQRALYVGAALRLDARPVLDGTDLSPGETRKLAIAVGLTRQPWFVVLDEPTNDLDIEAVERLEQALADFPGAMLLVTHDPRFAENLGCETIEVPIM